MVGQPVLEEGQAFTESVYGADRFDFSERATPTDRGRDEWERPARDGHRDRKV